VILTSVSNPWREAIEEDLINFLVEVYKFPILGGRLLKKSMKKIREVFEMLFPILGGRLLKE